MPFTSKSDIRIYHELKGNGNNVLYIPPRQRRIRFEDQGHIELLEVAQATVDQFARATRGARGPIALLDERDR